MRRFWMWTCLAVAAMVLPGCFERVEKITLNPDGSGKSQVDFYFHGAPLSPEVAKLPPKDQARRRAHDIIEYAQGVDAWKDVSFEPAPDGRIHFHAVAYFKNLGDYKVDQIGLLRFDWEKDGKGGNTLTIAKGGTLPGAGAGANRQMPSDEQVAQQVQQVQQMWTGKRTIAVVLMAHLKFDITFVLPGKVDEKTILQDGAEGVRFQLDGQQIIDGWDKRMKDEAGLAAEARAGGSLENPDNAATTRAVFGQNTTAHAHVGSKQQPLFDYEAEARAARKEQAAMLRRLELVEPGTPAPPLDAPIAPAPAP